MSFLFFFFISGRAGWLSDCIVVVFDGTVMYLQGAKYCACLAVCMSVCPRAYLRNYTFTNFLRLSPMAVARSSFGGVAIS